MTGRPFFSIVTPVFNRERIIRRALDSCLAQNFEEFEVLVVDDGSTDNTAGIVAGIQDSRIRLIRHAANKGAGPARNTAVRSSQGEWIICLDSDDELFPGCLSRIRDVVLSDQDHIGRFGFLYEVDGLGVSPSILPPGGTLGYEDWLRLIDRARWSDALWVTRRDTFGCCAMPEGLGPELKYNLDFSRNFRWKLIPEIVALVHTDSTDRLCFFHHSGDVEKELRRELHRLEAWNLVLVEHGEALRQHAPRQYRATIRAKAVSYALSGRRWRSLSAAAGYLVQWPTSLAGWAVFGTVVFGPRAVRWARALRAFRNSASRESDRKAFAELTPSISNGSRLDRATRSLVVRPDELLGVPTTSDFRRGSTVFRKTAR